MPTEFLYTKETRKWFYSYSLKSTILTKIIKMYLDTTTYSFEVTFEQDRSILSENWSYVFLFEQPSERVRPEDPHRQLYTILSIVSNIFI